MRYLLCVAFFVIVTPVLADDSLNKEKRLLATIVTQVTNDQIVLPNNDNAMDTWKQVLVLHQEHHDDPAYIQALQEFGETTRQMAMDARAQNQPLRSSEYLIFSDYAVRQIGKIPMADATKPIAPDKSDRPQTIFTMLGDGNPATHIVAKPSVPEPPPVPIAITEKPPLVAPKPVVDQPPMPEKVAVTLPTKPTVDPPAEPVVMKLVPQFVPKIEIIPPVIPKTEPVAMKPVIPEPPAKAPEPVIPAAISATIDPMAAVYAKRGDELMGFKDVTGARKFYEIAANSGDKHAAIAMARSYDQAFINQLGILGLKADHDLAAFWYHKADTLH